MKKNYEMPVLEIVPLDIKDIITSSGDAVLPDDNF